MDSIFIKGARTHNLKNVSLEIPRNKIIVITGLSGSGKSSLAFDTLYAEGQRRYVESLSTYARQFLSMMEKPDVDQIEGLSPAISIEQKSTSHNNYFISWYFKTYIFKIMCTSAFYKNTIHKIQIIRDEKINLG